jgi:hypothetical protein
MAGSVGLPIQRFLTPALSQPAIKGSSSWEILLVVFVEIEFKKLSVRLRA